MSLEKGAIMERLKIHGTAHPTSPFIAMEMREAAGRGGEGRFKEQKGEGERRAGETGRLEEGVGVEARSARGEGPALFCLSHPFSPE